MTGLFGSPVAPALSLANALGTGLVDVFTRTLAQTAAATPEAAENSKTVFDYLRDGGPLSVVLIGLSVIAVALMIRNTLALRLSVMLPEQIVAQLVNTVRQGNLEAVAQFCALPECDCLITRIFRAALARCALSPFGTLEIRAALEDAGSAEVRRLSRLNDHIAILAAIGPMLGLLGTVLGMIGAFGAIGKLQGVARSNQLAEFMSMALVNTAEGLIVAIPCTVAFALFRRRIDRLASDAAAIADTLAPVIERIGTQDRPAIRPPTRPQARPAPAGVPPSVPS